MRFPLMDKPRMHPLKLIGYPEIALGGSFDRSFSPPICTIEFLAIIISAAVDKDVEALPSTHSVIHLPLFATFTLCHSPIANILTLLTTVI